VDYSPPPTSFPGLQCEDEGRDEVPPYRHGIFINPTFHDGIKWVIPEKIHTLPTAEISANRRGKGEKKLFLIIVNVLGHPKGVGGLTSNFLRGGGMDVFWNEPIQLPDQYFS
jgi:hypothetical protein